VSKSRSEPDTSGPAPAQDAKGRGYLPTVSAGDRHCRSGAAVTARLPTVASSDPRAAHTICIDAVEASRLWNWVLARQGLHPATRLTSWAEVAVAALGIHSARLPTPIATVAARCSTPGGTADLVGRSDVTTATTIRCMRRTLHLLPVDLAVVAHHATLSYRERDAQRLALRTGAGTTALARTTDRIMAVLTDGPAAPRRIESTLATNGTPVPLTRAALKLAWERGILTYLNRARVWNQEQRVFALTEQACPGLLADLDAGEAVQALVAGYFDRYGPATVRDVMWWSALPRRDVVAAMNASDVTWARIQTPWTPSPTFMPEARYEEYLSGGRERSPCGVGLLAHEDIALKAYHETRARYLHDLAPGRVFNPIGEVLPTVTLDGRVVGRWDWDPRHAKVSTNLLAKNLPRPVRAEVTSASRALSATMRRCWAPASAGRAPVNVGQLTLAI
jgi:hypothetical protein